MGGRQLGSVGSAHGQFRSWRKAQVLTLFALAIIAKTAESEISVVWMPDSDSFFAMVWPSYLERHQTCDRRHDDSLESLWQHCTLGHLLPR